MKKTQDQTRDAFSFKWGEKKDTYNSEVAKQKHYEWSIERYFGDEEAKNEFIKKYKGKKMLDAGCGNGLTAAILFNTDLNYFDYLGVDIAPDAIEKGQERFAIENFKGEFKLENIQTMDLNEKYDVILSSGVIHHTDDPYKTFLNLVDHLNVGGTLLFYIYKKKAPVREFVDDYIRNEISGLNEEEAWEKMIPLTKFGKVLGDLNIEVEIEEDIELLGISKGKQNLQRLLYWNFFKAFYKPEYSLDEMNHVNFDWYRPLNCFRYEPSEIKKWIELSGLKEIRFKVIESGMTVVVEK